MKRYLPFIVLALGILLDQGSKIAVRDYFQPVEKLPFYAMTADVLDGLGMGDLDITVRLPRPEAIRLLGDFFWINFHENKGVAFGFMNSLPQSVTVPLFAIVNLLAIGFIIHFYRSFAPGRLLPRVTLMMILVGAIGNLIDRVILGKVTDFLDLALRTPYSYKNIWPIFNIADAFIVCGVATLFIMMLFEKKPAKTSTADAPAETVDGNVPPSGT